MDAEIIAVGSELLTPHRNDTNSLFLTDRLNSLGIEVRLKTIVGDDAERLAAVFRAALERSKLIILMGGLGPTEDDINRQVVADVLGRPLQEVPEVLERIAARYARTGRRMPPNNARQALVPEGAEWLPNKKGTAPGIWIEHEGKTIIMLPGPPAELEAMFDEQCIPRLRNRVSGEVIRTRVIKVAGLPESEVDHRIAPIYKQYTNPVTTILSTGGAIEVHLRAHASTPEKAEALLNELTDKIEPALGDHVFSTRGESLEEVVGMYLVMKQKTLATAESCTGGLLSERITRVPGSSEYFRGGAVCYSNELKTLFAGVSPKLLEMYGAVSRPVAQAMAEGIRKRTGASVGIGITGIAGPGGGTEEKPVGMVFIAVADEHGTEVREFRFPGDRDRVRLLSSQFALEMLRRRLRN
ncbi:MAG TPA: competence/damage-inducible protein A [Terriglobia bacterium]|jgi:nicotinamide-nucleotide amidase|nr:competence/damage-inducible protein A [Terriglobia bacterium]